MRLARRTMPPSSARTGSAARRTRARAARAGVGVTEAREDQRQERGGERDRVRGHASCGVASRVGYSDGPSGARLADSGRSRARPGRDPPRPDVPHLSARSPTSSPRSTRCSRLWAERRTFARLRAQNAGGPRWSFLDGPITANNPMGVHHAWGRTYKDLYQRYHAMLGEDQRYQNGFDCQGLWVEVNVERDLGFTSKRDIEAFGIAEFVSLCKQRVLTFAARQTEQSIRLGYWMDWNDPARAAAPARRARGRPGPQVTIEGPDGPVTDTVEMLVGRLGMPDVGGSYFTFSNENNDLIWGFLTECHRRGWIYKRPRHDAVVPALRHRPLADGDERGLPGSRGPGLTVRFPLIDRPGESLLVWTTTPWTLTANVAAAVGPDLRYVQVRQGDDAFWLGRRARSSRCSGARSRSSRSGAGAELVGWRYDGPVRRPAGRPGGFPATVAEPDRPYEHRVVAWDRGRRGARAPASSTSRRAAAQRTSRSGKELGLPVDRPDRRGRALLPDGFGWLAGRRRPRRHRRRSSTTSSGAGSSTTSRRTATATRTAGGARRSCCSGSSTSGSSAWARSTTSRARR